VEDNVLKAGIHPKYEEVKVSCACGESFDTNSTSKTIHVDICSACHPFFTGKQKIMDTEGRVEKFRKKYANLKNAKQETATQETEKQEDTKQEDATQEK
jgi:large subunit ribosomal protein L31